MSRRVKGILIVLAAVGGMLAAGYAAAPSLLSAIAVRSLRGTVEVRTLEIQSVGLTQLSISAIRVHNKQMRFDAQQTVVRFDLWPFQIRGVDIHKARLEITAAGTGGGTAASGTDMAPPAFPLQINELSVHAETPWGESFLPVSVKTGPGASGGLQAEVRGAELSAVLTNPAEQRHTLELRSHDDAFLLSLSVGTVGGFPLAFDGRLNPARITQWLDSSPAVPHGLRSVLADYSAGGGEVALNGTLERNLDFTAVVRGSTVLRDDHDPAERVFESIEFQSGSGYTIARSGALWSGSGDAGFSVALDPETTFTGTDPAWSWENAALSFKALEATLHPAALHADAVEVSAPGFDPDAADGALRARGLRMDGWPESLANYEVDGSWSLRADSWSAAGTGKGAHLPDLSWELEAAGDRGSMEIIGRGGVAELAPSLEAYTVTLAPDLNFVAGNLDGRYRVEWNGDGEQTSLELTAGSVDADFGEMQIRGLDIGVRNRQSRIDSFLVTGAAPTLQLAAGTVAEDLEIKLGISLPEIDVETMRARLFDGVVSMRPISINLNDDKFESYVDIDAVSLEKVMALFELESTQLTGTVAGPVRIVFHKAHGIEINKGALHNLQPGVLRFGIQQDSEMAAQLDNIALQALENFQYQELNASILYRPDGEYRITARILGNNPEVLDGHPIALNPTIEGRLPALFRAFFITGDFNQAIIERLQKERGLSTWGEATSLQDD